MPIAKVAKLAKIVVMLKIKLSVSMLCWFFVNQNYATASGNTKSLKAFYTQILNYNNQQP